MSEPSTTNKQEASSAMSCSPRIFTYYSRHCEAPWCALNMDRACALLEGYKLTEKEKTDGKEIIMGWGRLLEEAGLIFYGDNEAEVRDAAIAEANE